MCVCVCVCVRARVRVCVRVYVCARGGSDGARAVRTVWSVDPTQPGATWREEPPLLAARWYSLYLLYWYKSTNTDTCLFSRIARRGIWLR